MASAAVLPADPWGSSDVNMAKLQALIDAGLLRQITDPDRPEWIAPGSEPEPRPCDGYVVSFVVFHERGFGSPTDQFMRALPHTMVWSFTTSALIPSRRRPSSSPFARGI